MATTTAPASTAAATSNGIPGPIYIDTQHEDFVHDAQMDYYGAKLATCSSDRTIKIYNVFESTYELVATLQGHEGPVWQVSWAHPKFGVILASCSFDGSVLLHRENRPREWTLLHAARHLHESSINSIAFAPHEFGLMAAAASSDGRVSILKHEPNNTWSVDYLQDCPMGVNALSWAPYGAYYDAAAAAAAAVAASASEGAGDVGTGVGVGGGGSNTEAPRLVTGGCDNQIRFWVYNAAQVQWQPDTSSPVSSAVTHSDWVRDVAWAPNLLPFHNTVASCSEDRTVLIWKQTPQPNTDGSSSSIGGEWKATLLHTFDAPVWRVSWSVTGHLLAVSSGDSDITLWKVGLDGKWSQVSSVPDTPPPGAQANQG